MERNLSFTQSIILWAVIFILIGASSYVTDRKWGVAVYMRIRKWWHPPVKDEVVVLRGFIHNRSNLTRWKWASVISLIQATIMLGWGHGEPRMELILIFVITPATWFGFLIGPFYFRLRKLREKGLEKLDQVESGQIDLRKEVAEATQERITGVRRFFDGILSRSGGSKDRKTQAAAAPKVPAVPAKSKAELEREAREAIEGFKKGGR